MGRPMSKPIQTRRAFVAGAVTLVASAALGVAGKASAAGAQEYLRPPGSVEEERFNALCIKCMRCISVCPTSVVAPLGIEAGLAVARGPQLTFATNYCVFCDECRKVCPTGAIQSVDPLTPAQGRIGVAQVYTDTCLAFYEVGACGVCVSECDYDALSFDVQRRPVVNEAQCNGCGKCECICPANILTTYNGSGHRGIGVVAEGALRSGGGE